MGEIPTWATDIAAQIWCKPENENTVMDINLCTSFARALVTERESAAIIAEGFSTRDHIVHDMNSGDFPLQSRFQDALAAAIRKGE